MVARYKRVSQTLVGERQDLTPKLVTSSPPSFGKKIDYAFSS